MSHTQLTMSPKLKYKIEDMSALQMLLMYYLRKPRITCVYSVVGTKSCSVCNHVTFR